VSEHQYYMLSNTNQLVENQHLKAATAAVKKEKKVPKPVENNY